MGEYIRISTERLRQDRSAIQREAAEIGKRVEELAQEMQMLGQTWEGAAWQAFQGQAADDLENMRQVCQNLSVYVEHMEYAEKEYKACESQVEELAESIRI